MEIHRSLKSYNSPLSNTPSTMVHHHEDYVLLPNYDLKQVKHMSILTVQFNLLFS